MNALILILPLTCLVLGACGRNADQQPNPHDDKYTLIDDGETCVLDTSTQLQWQSKTVDAGLHAAANTYSWYNPSESHGELDYRGLADGGKCTGSSCDTWHYVQATNETGLCGHDDWRMPNKDELYSISDKSRTSTPPTTNTTFFPHMQSAEYWSGNDYSFQYDTAWAWNFELGHDRVDWKKEAKFVRLVRGNATKLDPVKD